MAEKDLVQDRASFGSIVAERKKDLAATKAVAADKESLLDQLTSTSGILQGILAAGALAYGEEEAAAMLGLRAIGDADSRAKGINQQRSAAVTAASEKVYGAKAEEAKDVAKVKAAEVVADAEVEEERLKAEATLEAQKRRAAMAMFEKDPKLFTQLAIQGGMTDASISKLLGLPEGTTLAWTDSDVQRQRDEALDPIVERLYSKLEGEPDEAVRTQLWSLILGANNYKQEDLPFRAEQLAAGTLDVEEWMPGLDANYDPMTVRDFTVAIKSGANPIEASQLLKEKTAPAAYRDTLDESDRLRTIEGQTILDAVIRETGKVPMDAVEDIVDPEMRAFVRDNYSDWNFPGTFDEMQLYVDAYANEVNLINASNDQLKLMFPTHYEDYLVPIGVARDRALDTVDTARRKAKSYGEQSKMRGLDATFRLLRNRGLSPDSQEAKELVASATAQAEMELGDLASRADVAKRVAELIETGYDPTN